MVAGFPRVRAERGWARAARVLWGVRIMMVLNVSRVTARTTAIGPARASVPRASGWSVDFRFREALIGAQIRNGGRTYAGSLYATGCRQEYGCRTRFADCAGAIFNTGCIPDPDPQPARLTPYLPPQAALDPSSGPHPGPAHPEPPCL